MPKDRVSMVGGQFRWTVARSSGVGSYGLVDSAALGTVAGFYILTSDPHRSGDTACEPSGRLPGISTTSARHRTGKASSPL